MLTLYSMLLDQSTFMPQRTYRYHSLIEVDAGIITACMPSFAKMLHHHLPPWPTLQSRLKLHNLASPYHGSQRNLVTLYKEARPTHLNNQDYSTGDRPSVNGTDSITDIELQSPESVKKYIRGAASETFDDDRVYLKHGSPQT